MEYYNNSLCVDYGFLIGEKIMSDATYRRLVEDGVLNRVRRACKYNPALITYNSLPCRFQSKIEEIVPNPHRVARINMVESRIEQSAEASSFFDSYTLADGRHLSQDVRCEYYANAIVLDAIQKFIVVKREKRAALNKRMVRSWDQLTDYVQEIDRKKYPHTLPANARRLEDKFLSYKANGYNSLIHKNFMNVNAAKVDDEYKESVLVEIIAYNNNLNNEQVAKSYNMFARKMNWKKITSSAVAVWRQKYDLETYAGRRGTTSFNNKKAMQIKRKAPAFPLYFWSIDGWDVELLYQKFENGRTTYHNRPTVVIVLDACLNYPIGYAVGTHETPGLIKEALRNAAKHTQELFGSMYRTQQLQSDHYSIKTLTPVYESLTERYTPARVGNAKSKPVEPYFGCINKTYCQALPNWSGFGITSDREKQPNMELILKHKDVFPVFDGVCKQVDMIIECERKNKVERFKELWLKTPEEHKVLLPYEQYLLQFGQITGFRNQLQGNGLRVTIEGVKHDYDCFDLSFREHFSVKWEVRYDPSDLGRVLAVNEDESLRFMMEEKYIQPMALIERKDGDYEQLQRVRDYNDQLKNKVIDFRAKSGDCVSDLFQKNPELDTLKKFLITDSAGQHKDRRNEHKTSKVVETAHEDVECEIDIYDMY